jgi:hypothetical protein
VSVTHEVEGSGVAIEVEFACWDVAVGWKSIVIPLHNTHSKNKNESNVDNDETHEEDTERPLEES